MVKMKDIISVIRKSFNTRQVKYGGYAVFLTIAVIAGLILLNLLVGQYSPQIDMTSNKMFSLSEQSLQVLEMIDTPVKFYGIWRAGDENRNIITIINLYVSKNKNISLEIIDPDRNPGFMVRYDRERQGISRGSLIVEGERGFRVIASRDMYDISASRPGTNAITGIAAERRITGALLFLATGDAPVVYEITGHGELPLAALGTDTVLDQENFTLHSLNLLLDPIPSDASTLILNSPRRDIAPVEAEKLLDYLTQGGSLLIMADFGIQELTNLNDVLRSYGLAFNYGIVRETDPNYIAIDERTLWPDIPDHEITRLLTNKRRTPVVVIEAMPLTILETRRRTVEAAPLLISSSAAFLRSEVDEGFDTRLPSDVSGSFIMAAAVLDPHEARDDEPQARIVAIGTVSLLPLAIQGFDSNLDLFMNSLNWLENRPETITVRSKSLIIAPPLRMNLVQIILFGVIFIFIIPMAFCIAGFITWLRRRHL